MRNIIKRIYSSLITIQEISAANDRLCFNPDTARPDDGPSGAEPCILLNLKGEVSAQQLAEVRARGPKDMKLTSLWNRYSGSFISNKLPVHGSQANNAESAKTKNQFHLLTLGCANYVQTFYYIYFKISIFLKNSSLKILRNLIMQ